MSTRRCAPERKAIVMSNATETTEHKALYAAAGVVDLAVEAIRELPSKIASVATDPEVRSEVRERLDKLPNDAKAFRDDVPEFLKDVPGKAAELPERLRDLFGQAATEAAKAFDEFAERGEDAVTKFRAEHGDTIDNAISAIRSKVADAADEVADTADDAADAISKHTK